jgi:hypothetical protein
MRIQQNTLALAVVVAVGFFPLPAFAATYIQERVIIQDDPGWEAAAPYAPAPGVIIDRAAPPLVVTEDEAFGPPMDYGYAPPPPFLDIYVGE